MIKQFKLIKKFPGGPDLGHIAKQHVEEDDGSYYWCGNWFNPQDFPEFWEEIVPKTYEILSFKGILPSNNGLFYLKDGLYYWHSWDNHVTGLQLSTMLDGNTTPYSVKRLLGSEVFTVGDNTNNGVIKEFKISGDQIRIYFKDKPVNYHVGLISIQHAKVPLFTTEDSVEIFEGDKYFWLSNLSNYSIVHSIKASKGNSDLEPEHIYFSTKQAAEDYIAKNEILFVTADGKEMKKGDKFYVPQIKGLGKELSGNYLEFIADFPRSFNEYAFSTKEKAQEYIDYNKPKYSKKQVLEALECAGLANFNYDLFLYLGE